MNYIVIIKNEYDNKEFRFLNVLTEKEKNISFIPKNCRIVSESTEENIFGIPIVNDGLSVVFFDPSNAFIKYHVDKRFSNLVIAIYLLSVGFFQNKSEKITEEKKSILIERVELLYEKTIKHHALIKNITNEEKNRETPFRMTEKLNCLIDDMNKSKIEIINIVKDIKNIVGENYSSLISDFADFN